MSDFQLEEDKTGIDSRFQSRVILGRPETPKMVAFMINKGIIKNEKTAGNVLIVISAVFFLSAIFIFGYFVLGIGA